MKALLALAIFSVMHASPVVAKVGRECDFSNYPAARDAESRAKVAATEWVAYSRDKSIGMDTLKADLDAFRKLIKGTSNEDQILLGLQLTLAEAQIDQKMRNAHPLAICFEQAIQSSVLWQRYFKNASLSYSGANQAAGVYVKNGASESLYLASTLGQYTYDLATKTFFQFDEAKKQSVSVENKVVVEELKQKADALLSLMGLKN